MSAELLRRIETFDIDGRPARLPFAARLAREHGWTRQFAERVVAEYKRFAYLAATAGHPVTPSQAVDHCWHLHLTYTRSYWERFCREVLPAPLHHDPTAGGPAERAKYRAQYERTLSAYRRAFGHEPPADVWPPAGVRFGDDLREVTVNTARNWVVPKGPVRRAAAAVVVAGLAIGGGGGCAGDLNPFELAGTDFFAFLVPAMLGAVGLGLAVRAISKGPGLPGDPPPLDWQPAALLAGGPERLLAAAVTRLTHAGAVRLSDDGKTLAPAGPAPADAGPAERAVLAGLPLGTDDHLGSLRLALAVGTAAADVRQRLEDDGMLMPDDRSKWVGRLAALPLLAVLVLFGLSRLIAGLANGRPVGFLVIALVVGTLVTVVLRFARPYRTRAGDQVRRSLAGRVGGDAGAAADPVLAVAALGTAALAGTELAGLHAWYPKRPPGDGGDGGGVDGGSGDGGGGGCGGGCGG